jgi:hypothetical protein
VLPYTVLALPVLLWLLLCSAGAYAFVRLNSSTTTSIVQPAGAASGYRVSNIAYTLGVADPHSIKSVKFALTPSSPSVRISTVRVKLMISSTSYFTCANIPAGSQSWVCPISGVSITVADQLKLDVGELAAGAGLHLYLPVLRR